MPRSTSVLLVDDDVTANFIHQMLIERAGVTERLLVAEDGAQALRTLAAKCQTKRSARS